MEMESVQIPGPSLVGADKHTRRWRGRFWGGDKGSCHRGLLHDC